MNAQYDTFTEQASDYARKLRHAGVKVMVKKYEGMDHGFFMFPAQLDSARKAIEWAAERVGRVEPASC